MEKMVHTLEEFNAEAVRFVETLVPKSSGATLVTLSGNLGAGKTAFVKAAAASLGVSGVVTSPTFVLEKIYALPESVSFKRLVHIDAYRLESGTELPPLGFDEIMKDPPTLVFLEWPEKVADALPKPAAAISITATDDSRKISYGAQT